MGIPGYIILTVNLHLDAVDPDAVAPDSSSLGGGVYGGEGGTSHRGDRKDRNHQKKRRCSDKYLNHQKKRRCSDRFFWSPRDRTALWLCKVGPRQDIKLPLSQEYARGSNQSRKHTHTPNKKRK